MRTEWFTRLDLYSSSNVRHHGLMTEILTQAWNQATNVYETFDREPGTTTTFMNAELSAHDLGCEPGTTFRLQQVDDEDRVINERYVVAG